MNFPLKWLNRKLMVASESVPQELSNEWSCQYVSTILNIFGNFCVLPSVTKRAKVSHHSISKKARLRQRRHG
jgi:hypothetical protein